MGDVDLDATLAAFGLAGCPRRRVAADPGKNSHWIVGSGTERVVVRRYEHGEPIESVEWELEVLAHVADLGWPAPAPHGCHLGSDGKAWSAFGYRPGRVRPRSRSPRTARDEQRRRGALLAEFHTSTADLTRQRPTWTTRAASAETNPLAELLRLHHAQLGETADRLQRELETTRESLTALDAAAQPARLIHGDFARWNLRFHHAQLSGLLDWEFSHLDNIAADFTWAWRGRYTSVIDGYQQITRLDETNSP